MNVYEVLQGSQGIVNTYIYLPLSKLLVYRSLSANGNDVGYEEEGSTRITFESSRHFGDWPNVGAFEAVLEQRDPIELPVHGQFPSEIAGVLYRTGPAHFKLNNIANGAISVHHWFDGFSCLYRFEIVPSEDGCRIFYSSRQQVDKLVEHVQQTGAIEQITFAQRQDPCAGFFKKLKTVFFSTPENPNPEHRNVGVTIHPEIKAESRKLVSRTDYGMTKEIDFDTLEPVGITEQKSLHPELKGPLSCAHVQIDPVTGDYFNYNLSFGYTASYKIFRTSASTGQTDILASITGPEAKPAYIHSFCLTENFVVLCIPIAHFKGKGASILWERNMLDAIAPFDPNANVQWYVVDRKHGNGVVARYMSDAMFTFHSVNAYEVPGSHGRTDVFCEFIEFSSLDVLHRLYYENLVSSGPGAHKYSGNDIDRSSITPRFKRYKLGNVQQPNASAEMRVGRATVQFELAAPLIGELPVINPVYSTKQARFVYTILDTGLSSYVDSLAKTDLITGETLTWSTPKHTPGEAVFVARNDPLSEDDGYLLSVVLNGENDTSYLLCLDARDMKEIARASASVPVAIGFHGHHLAQTKL